MIAQSIFLSDFNSIIIFQFIVLCFITSVLSGYRGKAWCTTTAYYGRSAVKSE